MHPRSRAGSLGFRDRGITTLPTIRNGQGGGTCTCVLLLPRWWPRANARLLLTLHPEIGCQSWTRTKTNGLTKRRATLTPPGKGAAGRTSTCIVPLGRRVPHVFGHSSNLKLVSAAGFAPAVTRSQGACARPQDCSVDPGKLVSAGRIALPVTPSQAGHVAATPRAVRPGVLGAHRGLCFMEIAGPTHLEPVSRGKNRKLADSKGVAPWVAVRKHLPADNGLLR